MFRMRQLLHEDTGQDVVEYGLLCALISIVAISSLKVIGPVVKMFYNLKYHIGRAG